MKHRRVIVTRHGGPEVLQLIEEEAPEPKPGEVRVKVLAAGVSAYDLMHRSSGALPGTPKPPFTLGEDIVGVVDKVATGELEPGTRVAAGTFALGLGGGYAEYVCLPARELVPIPDGVDPAEAVCVVVNYLTAHMAMHRAAKVRSGEEVLVHGAAGGVGSALLDLGRLAKLRMYGTASPHNHGVVSSMGAEPIDYHTEDFVRRVRELTGDGVDVVFDPIGGARQLRRSTSALRKGGRLVWFGVAGAKRTGLRIIPATLLMQVLLSILPNGKSTPLMGDLGKEDGWRLETLAELLGLLEQARIKPVVAARIPLAEAWRAHELLEHGRYAGKVVLVTE